jgi:tripartite-type tricarboxylate transporter receptor subunit TctC
MPSPEAEEFPMPATLPHRRRLLAGACAAMLGAPRLAAGQADAGSWPARTIRLVVPGAPGGLFDVWARQLADRLAPVLGQAIVPDHRVGAGGLPAMQHLARSAPDGYTFGICSFTQLTVNPWMFDKPAYDPVADFTPVTALWASQVLLAVRADAPFASLGALLGAAGSRPAQLSYGSSGVGQPPHVILELVEHRSGVHLLHIPYRGGPAAIAAALAGDVDMVFEGAAGLVPHVKAGRLRALAVTGERRMAALPEVPTFAEAGVAGIDNSWVGLLAPAGTAATIVQRLQQEIARLLGQPEMRASLEASGRLALATAPAALATLIRDTAPKWRELVRVAGLKPE